MTHAPTVARARQQSVGAWLRRLPVLLLIAVAWLAPSGTRAQDDAVAACLSAIQNEDHAGTVRYCPPLSADEQVGPVSRFRIAVLIARSAMRIGEFRVAVEQNQLALQLIDLLGGDYEALRLVIENNVGYAYYALGDLQQAIAIQTKVLSGLLAGNGTGQDIVKVRNDLSLSLAAAGRIDAAIMQLTLAVADVDAAFGADSMQAADLRVNAAEVLTSAGLLQQALGLARQAYHLAETLRGQDDTFDNRVLLGRAASALGRALSEASDDTAALPYLHTAVDVLKSVAPESREYVKALNQLGVSLENSGQLVPAAEAYREAAILLRRLVEGGPDLAILDDHLGRVLATLGQCTEAKLAHEAALNGIVSAVGTTHIDTAIVYANFARFNLLCGPLDDAIPNYRKASIIFDDVTFGAQLGASPSDIAAANRVAPVRELFLNALLDAAASQGNPPDIVSESFEVAQQLAVDTTSLDLRQMVARIATNDASLAAQMKAYQDAAHAFAAVQREVLYAETITAELTGRLKSARDRLAAATGGLPAAYGDLVRPKPASSADVHGTIKDDEALVLFHVAAGGPVWAWVVTKQSVTPVRLPIAETELVRSITLLRIGLDPKGGRGALTEADITALRDGVHAGDGRSVVGLFDLNLAHDLYGKLWAPLQPLLAGKAEIFVVPDGPLRSLPLGVLITTAPAGEIVSADQLRDVAWLVNEPYATTVLPSAGAFVSLRQLPPLAASGVTFVGFGDPAGLTGMPVASDASFSERLAASFKALPDSADEVRQVATVLGADPNSTDSVFLGADATEAALLNLAQTGTLAQARVVMFATHGVLADELGPGSEPGLVLTIPAHPTGGDDGYLSMSEIATLNLNASMVILSACNTAASDGSPDATGFSGLARAVLFTGARSVLVSNWSVYSPAAVSLTTGMFEELQKGVSAARALQAAERSLIRNGPNPAPAYWAPFILVGDAYL